MTGQRPYWKVAVSLFFSLLATAAFILAGIKGIVFFMPFVIGWILSAMISPVINRIGKRLKSAKKLGTAVMVILVLAFVVFILYFTVSGILSQIMDLIRNFPLIYAHVARGVAKIGEKLSGFFQRLPLGVQNTLDALASDFQIYMGGLVARISEPTFAAAGSFAIKLPSVLIAFIVAMLSAYFFTVHREEILSFFRQRLPESITKRMGLLSDSLKYAVGGYFKGQLKIMGVIFVIVLAGLMLLNIKYSIVVAFLIAFLDFLPFFGTGTVLIPWAAYEFFMQSYETMATLLAIYVIALILRQVLQPKLVGDSLGLSPILTLILIYTGFKLKGVLGFIFAVPVGMVVINMCKAGALDFIFDDVKILVKGILELRKPSGQKENSQK